MKRISLLVFLLLAFGILHAQTLDWSQAEELYPGICHLKIDRKVIASEDAELLLKGNVMRIDLTTPGLHFTSTARDSGWGKPMPDHTPANGQPCIIRTRRQTTPDFLKECRKPVEQGGRALNMVVAFNASPWIPWERPFLHIYAEPLGVNISDGVVIAENSRTKAHFVVWNNGQVELLDEVPATDKYPEIWLSAGGFDIILKDGKPTPVCETNRSRHPRTAFGLSASHQYLYVLTVDGRQPNWSHGATYQDLNALLLEAGACEAINMDGGGSTTLCYWDQTKQQPVVLSHATSQDKAYRPNGFNVGIYFTPH
ncbi:MAG: phosphodiester glycosidase family protein [Victivallales bacterium]|nr:phosphodiester glycosidase family protein [Victivallales bacterium]